MKIMREEVRGLENECSRPNMWITYSLKEERTHEVEIILNNLGEIFSKPKKALVFRVKRLRILD